MEPVITLGKSTHISYIAELVKTASAIPFHAVVDFTHPFASEVDELKQYTSLLLCNKFVKSLPNFFEQCNYLILIQTLWLSDVDSWGCRVRVRDDKMSLDEVLDPVFSRWSDVEGDGSSLDGKVVWVHRSDKLEFFFKVHCSTNK
jgi:hypothetical protein